VVNPPPPNNNVLHVPKIRNLMLSDFTTMMYGSCLSTTQQLSPQHYYKNSWKNYIVMFTCSILLYSFFHYAFQTDILFHWCSAFAGMCQIFPTANWEES